MKEREGIGRVIKNREKNKGEENIDTVHLKKLFSNSTYHSTIFHYELLYIILLLILKYFF